MIVIAVIFGGAVTSTDSPLADLTWPTFEGEAYPSISRMFSYLGLFFEHGHRLLIGASGIATIALVTWLFLDGECKRRPVMKKLAIAALILLAIPAGLGAATVLVGKSTVFSIIHVGFAMLFVSILWTIATLASPRWTDDARIDPSTAKAAVGFTLPLTIAIYIQVVLGAVPRHATQEFGGSSLVIIGDVIHILWAFAVFALVIMAYLEISRNHRKVSKLFHPALGLVFLLVLQIFLGVTTVVTQPTEPPSSAMLHAAAASVQADSSLRASDSRSMASGTSPSESTGDATQVSEARRVSDASKNPAPLERPKMSDSEVEAKYVAPATGLHKLVASIHQTFGVLMLILSLVLALRAGRLAQLSRQEGAS